MKSLLAQLSILLALTTYELCFAQTYIAGTTYAPYQHSGSCGRMIGVDHAGYVDVVWMNGMNQGSITRHVFYNMWSPTTEAFTINGGLQLDAASRAGYATCAVDSSGFCFPIYHHSMGQYPTSTVSFDWMPRQGAFSADGPHTMQWNGQFISVIWPIGVLDRNHRLNVVSSENPGVQGPQMLFYSRGAPEIDTSGQCNGIVWDEYFAGQNFLLLDTIRALCYDIAASRTTDRIALAYTKPHDLNSDPVQIYDAELYLRLSEDGGLNWGEPLNLTNFISADQPCEDLANQWRCCDRDTFRTYNDLSMLIDDANNVHIAFTSIGYYHWWEGEEGPFVKPNKAIIWHWDEGVNRTTEIAESWIADSLIAPQSALASGHAIIERPSLSFDPETNDLYCSYLKYDTSDYSELGRLSADIWISKSTNGGTAWSVGQNLTNTHSAVVPSPSCFSHNEQDESLADRVVNGRIYMFYQIDRSGSSELQCLDTLVMQRVSAELISDTPLIEQRPFHASTDPCILAAQEPKPAPPTQFSMYPAYPNPFNNSTRIRFELPAAGNIELKVSNTLGQTIEVLQSGMAEPGAHTVNWYPLKAGSGVYFVTLSSPSGTLTQKLLLLK